MSSSIEDLLSKKMSELLSVFWWDLYEKSINLPLGELRLHFFLDSERLSSALKSWELSALEECDDLTAEEKQQIFIDIQLRRYTLNDLRELLVLDEVQELLGKSGAITGGEAEFTPKEAPHKKLYLRFSPEETLSSLIARLQSALSERQ
ncbi:MAG TPA: hypothetical protein ENF82_01005 [Candidatus Methanomethylia archaeon]|nr:hypothetical protein [Candidatus Methanomethylicia archaeon]